MSEKVVVKYYANSEYAQEPFQATEGSAGYDLFASAKHYFRSLLLQYLQNLD